MICRFDNANAQLSTFTQFLHPDYSASNTNNDVCLLKLDVPLNFTSGRVAPVALNRNDDWDDVYFTVTGWGTTQVYCNSPSTVLVAFIGHKVQDWLINIQMFFFIELFVFVYWALILTSRSIYVAKNKNWPFWLSSAVMARWKLQISK